MINLNLLKKYKIIENVYHTYYCLLKFIYFLGLLATALNDICGLSINLHSTSKELI